MLNAFSVHIYSCFQLIATIWMTTGSFALRDWSQFSNALVAWHTDKVSQFVERLTYRKTFRTPIPYGRTPNYYVLSPREMESGESSGWAGKRGIGRKVHAAQQVLESWVRAQRV